MVARFIIIFVLNDSITNKVPDMVISLGYINLYFMLVPLAKCRLSGKLRFKERLL